MTRKRVLAFVPIPLSLSSPNGFAPRWLHFLRAVGEVHSLEVVLVRGLWHRIDSQETAVPEDFPAERVSSVEVETDEPKATATSLHERVFERLGFLQDARPRMAPRIDIEKFRVFASRTPDLVICFLYQALQIAEAFPSNTRLLAVLEEWPGTIPAEVPSRWIFRRGGLWQFLFWSSQRRKMIRLFRMGTDRGHLLLISSREARRIGRFVDASRISVIPHGVDCGYFRADGVGGDPVAKYDIAIVGVMSEPRNYLAAVRFFEATERIAGTRQLRWAFIGSNPSDALLRLRSDRVVVTGTVPDVRPYVAGARVIVVPADSESGAKGTVVLGWAMGRPVATTPAGMAGIDAANSSNTAAAGSIEELAERVLGLLDDERERARLAQGGQRTARELLDYRQLSRQFLVLCNQLLESPAPKAR